MVEERIGKVGKEMWGWDWRRKRIECSLGFGAFALGQLQLVFFVPLLVIIFLCIAFFYFLINTS